MNIKELVSAIAFADKKSKELQIGAIRKIIGIISDIIYKNGCSGDFSIETELFNNGKRRANKKGNKK